MISGRIPGSDDDTAMAVEAKDPGQGVGMFRSELYDGDEAFAESIREAYGGEDVYIITCCTLLDEDVLRPTK